MNEFTLHTEHDRQRLLDFLSKVDISRPLKFTWKLLKKQRGLDQNALLHVWMTELCKHPTFVKTKPTPHQMKEEFKARFLGYETVSYYDPRQRKIVTVKRIRRTRDLDTGEFNYFLQQIETWALHYLGVVLTSNKDDDYQRYQREQEAA